MDGNLAATYTLIHAFLTKRSHAKVAFALKKAVKDVVILKDDVDIEGPQLDEIVKQWKALDKKNVDSSDSDESSSDAGSSSAYSSDSDTSKQSPPKAISKGSSSSSSSSDSSSSSSDTDDSGTTKKKGNRQIPSKAKNRPILSVTGKSKKITPDRSSMTLDSSDTSDSDDSNNNEKESTKNVQKTNSSDTSSSESEGVKMDGKKAAAEKSNKKVFNSSSSNPSSSESEEELVVKVKGKSKNVVAAAQSKKVTSGSSASSGSTADTSSEEETTMKPKTADPTPPPPSAPLSETDSPKPTKKQRTSISGAAVTIATTGIYEPKPMAGGNGKQGKAPRKTNEPFKRIKPQKRTAEQIEFDNRYEAKTAPVDDYGAKAHQDLIVTRGAGFRKEKNKKKRGSYRGGEITMQSHSFKFTN